MEQYLLLSSTLGFSPDIEGQFQSYQEAVDTMKKNIQAEYQKYVQAYGYHFVCHCDKDYLTGYLEATAPITMEDYRVEPDGIVVTWMIQKIDVSEQADPPKFQKEKDLIRQNVLDRLRYINKSGAEASLTNAEVNEIVNRLAVPSETAYQAYLQYLVEDAIRFHEQKNKIRFKLACFRTELCNLLAADPRSRIISAIVNSLDDISKQIRLMFPNDLKTVSVTLQPEFDQYTQLNAMLSAYLDSKAYCDVKGKEHQNCCDDSEQEEEE